MTDIHPTALVERGAKMGAGVRVGPYCVIGPEVELGDGVQILSHVVVAGRTKIGARTKIYPFASIGHPPQDLKYKGEASELLIGTDNTIREQVTMNPGTEGGGMVTRVGNHCLFMVGAHVAHDCQVGDHVILANNATLAGHVHIGEYAILGGLSAIHQFVRIGQGAIIGAVTMVTNDVIPYGLVQAPRGELDGLNLVGLKRKGVSRADITALRAAFQMMAQGEGTFNDRVTRMGDETDSAYVKQIVDFVTAASDRSFLTPH